MANNTANSKATQSASSKTTAVMTDSSKPNVLKGNSRETTLQNRNLRRSSTCSPSKSSLPDESVVKNKSGLSDLKERLSSGDVKSEKKRKSSSSPSKTEPAVENKSEVDNCRKRLRSGDSNSQSKTRSPRAMPNINDLPSEESTNQVERRKSGVNDSKGSSFGGVAKHQDKSISSENGLLNNNSKDLVGESSVRCNKLEKSDRPKIKQQKVGSSKTRLSGSNSTCLTRTRSSRSATCENANASTDRVGVDHSKSHHNAKTLTRSAYSASELSSSASPVNCSKSRSCDMSKGDSKSRSKLTSISSNNSQNQKSNQKRLSDTEVVSQTQTEIKKRSLNDKAWSETQTKTKKQSETLSQTQTEIKKRCRDGEALSETQTKIKKQSLDSETITQIRTKTKQEKSNDKDGDSGPPQKKLKKHTSRVDKTVDLKCAKNNLVESRRPSSKSQSQPPIDEMAVDAEKRSLAANHLNDSDAKMSAVSSKDHESSDDEDLPKVDFTNDDKISEGDIVWVKHGRNPFWPALVMKVKGRNQQIRKVKIAFIEYEAEKLRQKPMYMAYSHGKIQPISKDYQIRVDDGTRFPRFDEAIKKVEQYFFVANNYAQKAAEFFGINPSDDKDADNDSFIDASETAVAAQEFGVGSENADEADVFEDKNSHHTEHPKDGKGEIIEVTDDSLDNTIERFSEETLRSIKERNKKKTELMECIFNSKSVKDHLEAVLLNRKQSEFQTSFFKPQKTRKEQFAIKTQGFGPIDDEDDIFKLKEFLHNYLCEVRKQSRQFEDVWYLTDVWMPEAIICGIQEQDGISRLEAEKIFYAGVTYTKEELKMFADWMISNQTDEDREQQEEKARRYLHNKMRAT